MDNLWDHFESILISISLILSGVFSLVLSLIRLVLSPILSKQTKKLVPKSILITGASSGIGKSLALKYSKPGVFLALTARTKETLETVAEECRKKGATVQTIVIDVIEEERMDKLLREIDQKHPFDLIIANAGTSGGHIEKADFEKKTNVIFDVNVNGVFNTLNPLLQSLRDRKRGQIVVVSSLSGLFGFHRSVAYSASKAALISYCRDLRSVMLAHNVGVNVVCPGFVETGFTVHSRRHGRPTPFLISADSATEIIIDGIEKNRGLIAFPFHMYLLTYSLRALPSFVIEFLHYHIGKAYKPLKWDTLG